jgi:pSer/pThr/pTyr-binding forkhead associated (FHA) protein/tetratricopeptide (TPR) repeat protein
MAFRTPGEPGSSLASMKLIIEDEEGGRRVVPVVGDEITIGRQDGNTIQLTERNVSRRHARLRRSDGFYVIEDLNSYNGVRINGERIDAPRRIDEGDLIEIGDYDLGIEGRIDALTQTPTEPVEPVPGAAGSAGAEAEETRIATTRSAPPGKGGATAIIRVSDLARAAPQVARTDLAKGECPRLIGLSQSIRGREFALERTDVQIGRARENDIAIEHPSLSRQHARLVREGGDWKVVDSHSANGVRVNGEAYAMSALRPGDVLELGHLRLRFCGPGEKFALPPGGDPQITAPPTFAGTRKRTRALVPLVVAAVMVAGGGAYLLKGRTTADETGESGAEGPLKAGDLLFRNKNFVSAVELYEQARAQGEEPANLPKAAEEARAQQIDDDLERALASGDFDKAKSLLEQCRDAQTYYCIQAHQKSDQVRQGYAKTHLDKARAAKGVRAEACQGEVRLVLASDPSNAEAQKLGPECAPVPPPQTPKQPPHRPSGQSVAVRDQKARELINAGNELVTSREYAAAMGKYQQVLELKPSASIVGNAYRGLGTAAFYGGDAQGAAKWFKHYLPYVKDPATRDQVQTLIRQAEGE